MTAVSKSDIAVRAYQIWESEGRPEGQELNHWLRAEAELATAALRKLGAENPSPRASGASRRSQKQ